MTDRRATPSKPRAKSPEPGPREVTDLLLDLLSRHEKAGPRLRAIGKVVKVHLTDVGLTLTVGPSSGRRAASGHALVWEWGRRSKLEPAVEVSLTWERMNRFAQGKENLARALAVGSLDVASGDGSKDREALLDALPVLVPLQKTWVAHLKERGLHAFLV